MTKGIRFMPFVLALSSALLVAIGCGGGNAATGEGEEGDTAKHQHASVDGAPLGPGEATYCLPSTFFSKEVPAASDLKRAHQFRLGSVNLLGLAVGDTHVEATLASARALAPGLADEDRFCTFYYNDGNDDALRTFNAFFVSKPTGDDFDGTVAEYARVLGGIFDRNDISFLSCARKGYLAMGCDGMRHRGPSVFAMLLAYTGCTPEHAVAIVNELWGENGIKPEMRTALARFANGLGQSDADQSAALRALLEN